MSDPHPGHHVPLIRFLVLGSNGAVGRAFTRLLVKEGRSVIGLDLGPAPVEGSLAGYFQADVVSPSPEVLHRAGEVDCVLACLPEDAILAAVDTLVPVMRPGALFADTSSVKSPIVARTAGAVRQIEYLSINPLFAPSVPFQGQNVAVVGGGGRAASAFLALLEGWGSRLVPFTVEEHDRAMACIQTATHAAILAFGMGLGALGYSARWIAEATTPPHRSLLALLARITGANPEVYWEIQRTNPYAGAAREALAQGIAKLSHAVDSGNESAFRKLFEENAALLGGAAPGLRELCAQMFAVPFAVKPPEKE